MSEISSLKSEEFIGIGCFEFAVLIVHEVAQTL